MNDPILKRIDLVREFYSKEELDGLMNWMILNGTDVFDEECFKQVDNDQKEFKELREEDLTDLTSIGKRIDKQTEYTIRVHIANEIHRMRIEEMRSGGNTKRFSEEFRIKHNL